MDARMRRLVDELAFDLDHVRLRAATIRQSFPPDEASALLGLIEQQLGWAARRARAITEPPLDVAAIGREVVEAELREVGLRLVNGGAA